MDRYRNMCIPSDIYIYIYIYVCVCVCVYVPIYIYIYIYTYFCVCSCMRVCVCIRVFLIVTMKTFSWLLTFLRAQSRYKCLAGESSILQLIIKLFSTLLAVERQRAGILNCDSFEIEHKFSTTTLKYVGIFRYSVLTVFTHLIDLIVEAQIPHRRISIWITKENTLYLYFIKLKLCRCMKQWKILGNQLYC